jgi:hypothetical protein
VNLISDALSFGEFLLKVLNLIAMLLLYGKKYLVEPYKV